MNLFIDTPQRAAARMEREQLAHKAASPPKNSSADEPPDRGGALFAGTGADEGADGPLEGGAPQSAPPHASADVDKSVTSPAEEDGCYSVAEESYKKEKAFDRRRARRRKLAHALRIVATIVFVPFALAVVFFVSYALTCILNGASVDELSTLMIELLVRIEGLLSEVLATLACL